MRTQKETDLQEENERLTAELADANNSFGSQTANWPGLAERIEDLKQLSNERRREIECLRLCSDQRNDALIASCKRNSELQDRIAELEAVVNGGEHDDPYAMWDRACKYQTAVTEQEDET